MKSLTISISLILISIFSFSQEIFFKHYTVNDGLPSDKIRALHKDSRGYLWVGTNSGVSMFDGRDFVNYSMADGLCGQKIWSITEDGHGNMWFGSYGNGLSIFDGQSFTNIDTSSGLPSNEVRCLDYFPECDLVFVGTENGAVYHKDRSFTGVNMCIEEEFTPRVMDFDILNDKILIALYSAPQKYSTFLFDPKTGEVKGYDVGPSGNENLAHKGPNVSKLFVSSDEKLYCSIDRLGFRALSDNKTDYLGLGQVFGITEDKSNNIWVSAWVDELGMNGGGLFKLQDGQIRDISKLLGLDNDVGWSVLYDEDFDAIWYGSYKNGLFFIPKTIFNYELKQTIGLNEIKINDLLFDVHGNFWMTTYDTIYCRTKQNKVLKYSRDVLGKYEDEIKRYGFSSIKKDKKNNLFIAGPRFSLYKFDENLSPEYFGRSSAYFDFDEENNHHGGDMWSYVVAVRKNFYSNFQDIEVLGSDNKQIRAINTVESNGEEVWVGSMYEGLFVYTDIDYRFLNKDYDFLSTDIKAICFDKDKNAIVGSNNGEVYFLDYVGDSLIHFATVNEKNGLEGNTIRWLCMGLNNNLFIGTEKGINILKVDSLLLKNKIDLCFFNSEEGLYDYTGNNATLDTEGNILIGTDYKLIRIDYEKLCNNGPHLSKVFFSGIRFINADIIPETNTWSGMMPDKYKIPHKDNYFEIRFDRINFLNSDKDIFRIKLRGLDEAWSEWSKESKVVYTGLNPGKYKLEVECKNLSSGITYKGDSFAFSILPPWYRTWWFYCIVLVVIIIAIRSYIVIRTSRIRKKEERKSEINHKISQLETKALQAQMNPHFTFNAITSIQNYILDKDVDSALKYLSDFSRIIRMTLDNVNKDFISIAEEIEYLKYYLSIERMRFDEKFKELFEVDNKIDEHIVLIPPMILQPFVENAIHHGLMPKGGGIVRLEFKKKDDNTLRCIVEDNGIGRQKENGYKNFHKSMGSAIAKDRIEYFNKNSQGENKYSLKFIDLNDANGKARGTRVVIDLPLKYNH
ncbi:histidine kinase [Bacteroidota bacterium]